MEDPQGDQESERQIQVRAPANFNRYRCAERRLKMKNEQLRNALKAAKKVTSVQCVLKKASAYLTPKQLAFFQMQMELSQSNVHAIRFSDEQLMECLALYYQGPRAYRHLRRQFVPPSPRSLKRRIEVMQVRPGFQKQMIAVMIDKFQECDDH